MISGMKSIDLSDNISNHYETFKKISVWFLWLCYFVTLLAGCTKKPAAVIYIEKDASKSEELAAREIRKYVYQRTGELLPVSIWNSTDRIKGNAILVGSMSTGMMKSSDTLFLTLVRMLLF